MFPFPPSARISVWHKVFGQGLHVESRPTYMYIKPNLLWMKLWTPLFPNFIAVSFRHLTIMYLYFKHLTISYQYAKQDSQNSSIHCNFTSFKKKKIINWEQGRYKNIFEIAVGETALFAVLSKWLWQGGRPMWVREHWREGARVCHYPGLPVCWFTLSLHHKHSLLQSSEQNTRIQPQNLLFLKIYREKCKQAAQFLLPSNRGRMLSEALWECLVHMHCMSPTKCALYLNKIPSTLQTIQTTLIFFKLHWITSNAL